MRDISQLKYDLRESAAYVRRLSNGWQVLYDRRRHRPALPPYRFRNGTVWYHGDYDEPVLLFREFYVNCWMPSLQGAPAGSVVVDIGANIGAATLFWAGEEVPGLVIHAYEPNPQAFLTLQRNVAASRPKAQVTLHQTAVAGERGEIELWVDVPTILSTSYGASPGVHGRKVTVPAVTLDDVLADIPGEVWLLKVDTEGAEGAILSSVTTAALQRCRSIVLEWHDNLVPGVSDLCRRLLIEAGFRVDSERPTSGNEGMFYCTRA